MLQKLTKIVALVLVFAVCLQIVPIATTISDFSDVPGNHWAFSAIVYVVNKGYMGETNDGEFEPDANASRAMMITTLYRLAGQPAVDAVSKPFSDVELGVWYSNPIIWAKSIGVIDGHTDGAFRPNDAMPREQLALIMYRYAQYKGYDLNVNGANVGEFPDFFETPSGCQTAMKWAIKKGMLIGREGYLRPNYATKRSELATCLYRFEVNSSAVRGISFKNNTKEIFGAWSGYLPTTIVPADAGNKAVYWASSDESVVKVDFNTGLVTTTGTGTANIVARTSDGGYTATCTVTVNGPDDLIGLVGRGLMNASDLKYTDEADNFFLATKSLGDILIDGGVSYLLYESTQMPCQEYYDDWYLYAVPSSAGYVYGLAKMREEEGTASPGVTVCFISFSPALLYDCLDGLDDENMDDYRRALEGHIDSIVSANPENHHVHNSDLYEYFSDAASDGSYLIINEYVEFIGRLATGGSIDVPAAYDTYVTEEVAAAVNKNNDDAHYSVVYTDADGDKHIQINDPQNLTKYEKYAIMMTHTANINYYSFAAEVLIHARGLERMLDATFAYSHLIRADMSIDTNREGIKAVIADWLGYNDYNDMESDTIGDQQNYHNEEDWL